VSGGRTAGIGRQARVGVVGAEGVVRGWRVGERKTYWFKFDLICDNFFDPSVNSKTFILR